MASVKKPLNIWEKFGPFMFVGLLAMAFVIGNLWQKVNMLEQGGSSGKPVDSQVAAEQNDVAVPETDSGKLSEEEVSEIPQVASITETINNEHIRGSENAEVFLIEYSDFECPFCARFHSTAQQVVDEYDGEVAWVYRHYPLDTIHPKARPAAYASECIAEQGGDEAFWQFADLLFEDPSRLNDLEEAAGEVGYNNAQFQECFETEKYKSKVDEQFNAGVDAGVRGTPGNFIVNREGQVWYVPGAYPFESIKETIDEALGN